MNSRRFKQARRWAQQQAMRYRLRELAERRVPGIWRYTTALGWRWPERRWVARWERRMMAKMRAAAERAAAERAARYHMRPGAPAGPKV